MAPVVYPTEHKLTNYQLEPSTDHADCLKVRIRPYTEVIPGKGNESTTVAWELDSKPWVREKKGFEELGTQGVSAVVENGFLIVTNRHGNKASLRLPKSVKPDGPVIALDEKYLHVTVQKACAPAA